MAFALGVPSVEGLMRNRYVGRTFIEGTADRAAKARLKYTPLPEVLAGKRVLLVEDSIVRSTTMRAWCTRSATAAERGRSTSASPARRSSLPAITASTCRARPSFSPRPSSIARGTAFRSPRKQRMAKELGADSLRYLPVEAIARSVSLSPERLCRACITGQLPHRDRPGPLPDRKRPSRFAHKRQRPPRLRVPQARPRRHVAEQK